MSMDDVVQGVIDTIDTISEHRIRLSEQLQAVTDAKSQVAASSQRARHQLEDHFKELKAKVVHILDERQRELDDEVKEIEEEAEQTLDESETEIRQSMNTAKDAMEEGRILLSGDHESNISAMEKFKTRDNDLGINRLPEVPALSEVACIHVDLPESPDLLKAKKSLKNHGKVLSKAPVQISGIQQRPGALMVRWTEGEEEHWLDLNEYRLQYYEGRMTMTMNDNDPTQAFVEAYQGSNTCHVVRHLLPAVTYTFRVCGRAEGASMWSPWGVPQEAVTAMSHYEWSNSLPKDYTLSIENTAACKAAQNTDDILYSNSNTYVCGHIIIFKILDTGHEGDGMDGIALSATNDNKKSLLRPKTIFVSCQGIVYIDGVEKQTRLPALTRGSVLTFETVVLHSSKVRVTIEVNERIVTFDWSPDESCQNPTTPESPLLMASAAAAAAAGGSGPGGLFTPKDMKDKNLFFALRFQNKDWKVSVE